jgi:Methyltransferase FkbM domain
MRSAFRLASMALNLSVARQTKRSDLLGLLRQLRVLNCGVELIRLGRAGDGGYLVPDDLSGIGYCFSPGVGPSSEFEEQLADRNIRSFLADYSVDSPPIDRPEFIFDKKYLGVVDADPYITLATWKDKYLRGHEGDLLLQMDIEGAEYEVILSAPIELLNQFRILVIEFHSLHKLFDPFAFGLIAASFRKLLQSFYVVHIHPNNSCEVARRGRIEIPSMMEFTFINKKRVSRTSPQTLFPHRLDCDNFPLKTMVLPKCWYADV